MILRPLEVEVEVRRRLQSAYTGPDNMIVFCLYP